MRSAHFAEQKSCLGVRSYRVVDKPWPKCLQLLDSVVCDSRNLSFPFLQRLNRGWTALRPVLSTLVATRIFLERNQTLIASSIYTKNMTISAMVDYSGESLVMPTQHLRMALRELNVSTELVERLLRGTGISPADLENPHLKMPASSIWPLCDNIAAIFGEDWFLKLPVLWSSDIHSELGMAMRVAPDLRTAIDVVTEFAHIRWPVVRLSRLEEPNTIIIAVKLPIPTNHQNWQLAMCIVALAFQTIARTILSYGSETIRYQFEGEAPSYAERLASQFEGNASWGHSRAAIIVPKVLGAQASPVASEVPFTALLSSLRKLAAARSKPHSDIMTKVSLTLDSLTRGRLDAVEVARKLGMSKRTLERRLAEEGTSFRDLSNESYKKRLEHLLLDPRMTADVIAERLGYHDASSLLRASRRLYGVSLSQLRRQVRSRGIS